MQYSQISPAIQNNRTFGEWVHIFFNAPLHDQVATILSFFVIVAVLDARRRR